MLAQAESPRDFIKQDEGRKEAGSGRPTLKKLVATIGGHNTVVFRRQELVNHDEDASDHLITGNGYTWLAVISVHEQVEQLQDVNSFFGNLRNGGMYEGIWGHVTDDNRVWIGSRNGVTFGRWDHNNPMVLAPELHIACRGTLGVILGLDHFEEGKLVSRRSNAEERPLSQMAVQMQRESELSVAGVASRMSC
jgi:hypothetical protein